MFRVEEIDEHGLERLCAVRNAIWPNDPEEAAGLADWKRQAEHMAWFLLTEDGDDLGAGYALTGWHAPPGVGHLFAGVLPDRRGRGGGSLLLRRLGEWLAEHGCAEATAAAAEGDEASRMWLMRRGFGEVGRNSMLALTLEEIDAPEIAPPPGIEIVPWNGRSDLLPGMYDVNCEAAPDIPGEEDAAVPSLEEWLVNDLTGAHDDPTAVFVALEGETVVGFAKLSHQGAGTKVAFHDLTGVLRAARRRGIAGALKRAEIAWAKNAGFTTLKTFNENRNEPIRRLNEKHGYRPEPGFVRMRGPVRSRSGR